MAKGKRTRKFSVTVARATAKAEKEQTMTNHPCPKYDVKHVQRLTQLSQQLNLSRIEVIKRAVLLLYDNLHMALQLSGQADEKAELPDS